MTVLVDFPEEVWRGVLPYIKNYHFVRLVATGDAPLRRRLCAVRGRHFDVPHDVVTIPAHATGVLSSAVDAHSLKISAYKFAYVSRWNVSFSTLADLSLVAPRENFPPLPAYDFKPLASLLSLTIKGYLVSDALSLPPSITSVKVDRFNRTHPSNEPISDMSLLTSLVSLHVHSAYCTLFKFTEHTVWPPHIESLSIHVDGARFGHLPRGLKKLKLGVNAGHVVDVFDLVTNYCPSLVALNIRGCTVVASRLPLGLEKLRVDVFSETATLTFLDAVENLPRSLTRLRFASLLSDNALVAALNIILPRLDFGDFDNACRVAIQRATSSAELATCLTRHALRWFDNSTSLAAGYVAAVQSIVSTCWQFGQTTVSGQGLYFLASVIGDDWSRRLFPRIIAGRPICTDLHGNSYLFEYSSKMLELGVSDSLTGLSGRPSVALSPEAIGNLVAIRDHSSVNGFCKMESFLQQHDVLPRLEEVTVADDSLDADALIDILYAHRSKLPALQSVYCHGKQYNGLYAEVSDESVAKMADMRLYPREKSTDISFIYRVEPPGHKDK